jgi:2-succinyl-6-hydroxy-2,4-cyclohexadiene-1-carboxylate synthase
MEPTSDHTLPAMIHVVDLYTERSGRGRRLVLVHGFTQTRRCWGPEADVLAVDHEVVRIDAPGHGRSAAVDVDLPTGGQLIGEQGGRATYVGYSMGARFCLHLALGHPELVEGLVLLGATAGIDGDAERAARRQLDQRTADRIRAEGVEPFLDWWLAQPLFASLPPERAFRAERLENTAEGLASSLERAGTGSQAPCWDRLSDLAMPVLVLTGAEDAKFTALATRLADAIGTNATLAQVAGAGHAAHLEQPDRFLAVIRPWLARHGL